MLMFRCEVSTGKTGLPFQPNSVYSGKFCNIEDESLETHSGVLVIISRSGLVYCVNTSKCLHLSLIINPLRCILARSVQRQTRALASLSSVRTCPKQGMVLRAQRLKLRMRAWLDGFLFSSSTETQQLAFRRIERNFSDLNALY